MIPKEEQEKLPADENTPEKRADKLWACFNKKDNGKSLEQGSWPLYTVVIGNVLDRNGCLYRWYDEVKLKKNLSLCFSERLAEGEFIQGVMDNENALHLIQYEPRK